MILEMIRAKKRLILQGKSRRIQMLEALMQNTYMD